ncbi:Hypothetical protein R9X50_00389300 [Acrodontium crateriforme]|uniref:Uncharacterized protein n=1 Tax=Acrodontium crateriforme TaxID=150365 RepID=A0AAQ3M6K9_9PEZI|nr:Hypothetical protein R9X50_00389300 [Acrodontium crateriforme]
MATSVGPGAKRKRLEYFDLTANSETESDDEQPSSKTTRRTDNNTAQGSQSTPPGSKLRAILYSKKSRASHENSPPSASQSVYPSSSQVHPEAERDRWLSQSAEDGSNVNEIISSTQDAADNEQLYLYGELPTKIVGVQYYKGIASDGEYILMRREPANPYDRNALRVDNVGGIQIGHIPRKVAEKLSKYIDNNWFAVEGSLAGRMGHFDCPLMVQMYGPDPKTAAGQMLQHRMTQDKLPLKALREAEKAEKRKNKELEQAQKKMLAEARRAAAGGKGGKIPAGKTTSDWANQSEPGLGSVPVMEDILEASERFNPRQLGESVDQHGMQEEALKNMPKTSQPKAISTQMLPYQLQALKWLLDQESPKVPANVNDQAVQLWKRNDNSFTNIASNYTTNEAPKLASGGILADDMGLGKTLEMIALIVADAEKNGRGTTLIVSPLSVMSNWSGQISHHLRKDKGLKVYTYHGAGRVPMKAADFKAYDVVITTYQTLAIDWMPKSKSVQAPARTLRSSGLYSVEWRRVILDEGHIVRNPVAKGAKAVCSLISRSRWVLTGTPIINSLKDLYSLLRFVGVTGGLEQLECYNSVLVRPLKRGDESATLLLKAIMTAFTLRRRKEMKFIDLRLPKLSEFVHRVEFTKKERERYEVLEAEAKGLLKDYQRSRPGENKSEQYQTLLTTLLRMRQCCNHWQLCGERLTNLMSQLEKKQTVTLTPENIKALQDTLQIQIESQEDCAICLEILHEPVITTCAHAFGRQCISKVIETQHKCPMCRAELKSEEACLVEPANECGDEEADEKMDLVASSSKLDALIEILAATENGQKGDKTIVFSQWTKFLDIVQLRLDSEGFQYCRLDGTMPADARDAALTTLEQDPKCTIMLASLGVCAVGLNLTAANQIVLSDTWWAPAIEDQAVDRVHRLGQTKETRVFRLVMDKSIEERTLQIQGEKRKLMMLAFSERTSKRGDPKAGRLADIQQLLSSQ